MNPLLREIKEPGPAGCGDRRCNCAVTGLPCVLTAEDIAHGSPEPVPLLAGVDRAVRPPLGVMPRQIWIDKCKAELARAISEHVNAGILGPVDEWWIELRQLSGGRT